MRNWAIILALLGLSMFVGGWIASTKMVSTLSLASGEMQAKVTCPNAKCKKQNPATNRFCEFCGATINSNIAELGGNVVCLVSHSAKEREPSWSPVGNRIAYTSNRFDDRYRLYMSDAFGKPIKLAQNPEISGAPAWSNDGKRFYSSSIESGITKVCEFDLSGKRTNSWTGGEGSPFEVTWSSRNSIYAFQIQVRIGNVVRNQIYKVEGHYIQWISDQTAMDSEPEISPDGTKIVFVSTRDDRSDGSRQLGTIHTMDINGKSIQKLTGGTGDDSGPTWSRDGKRIAFSSRRIGNTDIYVMDADGSNLRRLTSHPEDDWGPTWSPDGKRIAYTSSRTGNGDIYVMTLKL